MEAAIFLCVNNRLRHQNRVYGEAVFWHPQTLIYRGLVVPWPDVHPDISGSRVQKVKTVILKAVQSVFKLLLLPAVTLHLNQVLSSFSFTRVTICAVIYASCCFVFVFAAGVLFPCT